MPDGLPLLRPQLLLRAYLRCEEARRESAADRPIPVQLELSADIADDEANNGYAEKARIGDEEEGYDRRDKPR